MRFVWAAIFALCAFGVAVASAAPFQQWENANRVAIAKIASAKDRAAARRTFDATLARIAARGPAMSPSASPAQVAASELAIRGRYDLADRSAAPPAASAWDRFMNWLGDGFRNVMDKLFGVARLGGTGASLFGDLLLVLIAAGLIGIGLRFWMSLQVEHESRGGAFTPLQNQRNAHALYLQACAFAQDGAYDAAVVRLFLAAVTALDLRGVLRDNPSATVGDMRRILRGRDAALVASFDDVAAPFVDATYAETAIAQTRWAQAKDAYVRLTASEVIA